MPTSHHQAEALFAAGSAHLAAHESLAAERCYREAISLDPLMVEAYANLGWILGEQQRPEQANAFYQRALALGGRDNQLRLNYGAFLAKLKHFDAAERVYTGALDTDSQDPRIWSNLGALYAQMERFDEAEAACRTSLSIAPGYPKAHVNLAYLCLRSGRFEEGHMHFEWRPWQANASALAGCPHWVGGSLRGKSILAVHEGGHGDTIQFSRYVRLLKAAGAAHVTLMCPPPLQALLGSLKEVDSVISTEGPVAGRWDYWVSLMSLPHRFRTRVESIPAELPYLHANEERVASWRAELPRDRLLVGLAWQGSARFENDGDRSIHDLSVLARLADVPGVRYVMLQRDATPQQLASCGLDLHVPRQAIDSFADAAALLAALDLVIAVDTALAHLAGALAKPCWLMLPRHMTDWRWLSERSDSPWYPQTMKLYRQHAPGEWATTLDEVRADLVAWPGRANFTGEMP